MWNLTKTLRLHLSRRQMSTVYKALYNLTLSLSMLLVHPKPQCRLKLAMLQLCHANLCLRSRILCISQLVVQLRCTSHWLKLWVTNMGLHWTKLLVTK